MYICTLEVHFQKFVAGFVEEGEALYNISALYINISELEVRDGSGIYAGLLRASPRKWHVMGHAGRQAGM